MPAFTPANPDYRARTRDSFARMRFMETIGARLRRVDPGRIDIELKHRPELTQQHGFFHGGLVGTLADTAGGFAAFTLFPADCSVLTVEFKLNLMAPGQGERLLAISRVVRSGRTLTVCHSDVYGVDAGERRHCATALVTLMALHGKPDDAGIFARPVAAEI